MMGGTNSHHGMNLLPLTSSLLHEVQYVSGWASKSNQPVSLHHPTSDAPLNNRR